MREGTSFRRLKVVLAGCVSLSLLVTGCKEDVKSTLSEAEYERIAAGRETVAPDVLLVGGDTITWKDVITSPVERDGTMVTLAKHLEPVARTSTLEEFKRWARPQLEQGLMDRISNTLLYQAAKRDAGEKVDQVLEKAAQKEMRVFIQSFEGDEAKAEEALRQMGMDRKTFMEYKKRVMLTQTFVASKFPDSRPITHSELLNAYDQMKAESFLIPAMVRFRLIDIDAAKLEIADPNKDGMSQARELAKRLITRIEAGEDFAELARQYSHGHRREFDGLWNARDPDSLAQPYDVLAANAEKMQAGQIAGPIEVAGHVFIMKLEDKRPKGYEPLDKVQQQVEQRIFTERRKEAFDKLNAKIMQQATLRDTGQFVEFCLEKIHKMYNQ
ncbi:MAG: peptidylprolyl isomerase [Phycisphaerales bacterium]|nr:MAG: peptidylprolyl isomerase [Phycisphaerales bacterium]